MPAIYHGKIKLKWCRQCNVPLAGSLCNICSTEGSYVSVTPPGDVRPAFEGDLDLVHSLLKEKYGIESELRSPVLMNRLPAEDLAYEIICCGTVVGILKFVDDRFDLFLKAEGAELFRKLISKRYVVADASAEKFLLEGKNLMSAGVIKVSSDVGVGDPVVVFCGNSIGVGISRIMAENIPSKGVAVKIKNFKKVENETIENYRDSSWKDAVAANEKHIRAIEREAIRFIKKLVEEIKLPVLVSFSGGKDSMATLILLLKSGICFNAFFVDTGLEFSETLEYVREVEKKYNVDIDVITVGDKFWKLLYRYGVPARNYRWCCKVVKLGPTAKYILQKYPSGSLTFIGQRRYESSVRSKSGRVWRNPWILNQIGASPIYNWNAFEVFLYLFYENAPINKLYFRGLNRIGCYLCPASDLGDLEIARKNSKEVEEWLKVLEDIAIKMGYGKEWISKGLWRWRESSLCQEHEIEIDNKRYNNLMKILPKEKYSDEDLKKIYIKARDCVGCGVCLPYCVNRAIYIYEDRAWINEEKCNSCGKCLKAPCLAFYT